jgi:transposase
VEIVDEINQKELPPELAEWAEKLASRLQLAERKLGQAEAELRRSELKIEQLTYEIARLRRHRFGNSRHEALSAVIPDMFEGELNTELAAREAELEAADKEPSGQAPTQKGRRRSRTETVFPDHFPRVDHLHDVENCQCGECGGEMKRIGEDVSEKLNYIPGQFVVHRHIYPKYACRPCERLVSEPTPPALIEGGMAEAGLYTWVLISKYVDHLPLYRIEQIAARSGVILQRSTLSKWVGKIGLALEPLYKRLIELLLTSTILHIDETPVRQLNPGSGKTVKAWLWGYRTGTLGGAPPITVFDYQNSRKGECVRDFIGNWSGALMVDDYGAYKQLFGGLTERTELGCMAHARRKFVDLYEAIKSPIAGGGQYPAGQGARLQPQTLAGAGALCRERHLAD